MPSLASLGSFAVASAVIVAVPGPGVLFVIGRSLALGRRGGLLTVVGNEVGAVLIVGVVALGIGTTVAKSVAMFTAVKLLGAAYLVYLGIKAFRDRHDVPAAPRGSDSQAAMQSWQIVREGVIVGVTNPKDIVFFIAVLPQFVDVHAGEVPGQMLVLGLVFTTIAFICDGAWALVAGTGGAWLSSSPRRLAAIRGCGAAMVVVLGVSLVFMGNAV